MLFIRIVVIAIQMSDNSAEGIQNDQIKTENVEKKDKKTVIPQGVGAAGKVWRKKHEQKQGID